MSAPENALRKARDMKITHGRHCTCSACAREDWTNPGLSCCGMHGEDCPALYQPLGPAGTPTEQRPRLTYEQFRDEMADALRMDLTDPERDRVIRELWDMARERGRQAANAVRNAR